MDVLQAVAGVLKRPLDKVDSEDSVTTKKVQNLVKKQCTEWEALIDQHLLFLDEQKVCKHDEEQESWHSRLTDQFPQHDSIIRQFTIRMACDSHLHDPCRYEYVYHSQSRDSVEEEYPRLKAYTLQIEYRGHVVFSGELQFTQDMDIGDKVYFEQPVCTYKDASYDFGFFPVDEQAQLRIIEDIVPFLVSVEWWDLEAYAKHELYGLFKRNYVDCEFLDMFSAEFLEKVRIYEYTPENTDAFQYRVDFQNECIYRLEGFYVKREKRPYVLERTSSEEHLERYKAKPALRKELRRLITRLEYLIE